MREIWTKIHLLSSTFLMPMSQNPLRLDQTLSACLSNKLWPWPDYAIRLHQYMTHVEVMSPVKWAQLDPFLPPSSLSHMDTPSTTLGRLWWLMSSWNHHRGRLCFCLKDCMLKSTWLHFNSIRAIATFEDIKFIIFLWDLGDFCKLKCV